MKSALDLPTKGIYIIRRSKIWMAVKVIEVSVFPSCCYIKIGYKTISEIYCQDHIECCKWAEMVRKGRVFRFIYASPYVAALLARDINRFLMKGTRKPSYRIEGFTDTPTEVSVRLTALWQSTDKAYPSRVTVQVDVSESEYGVFRHR